MTMSPRSLLLHFLQDKFAVPETSIELALHYSGQDSNLFPIVLWQYGLVTLEQLDEVFDWIATAPTKQEFIAKRTLISNT